MQTKDIISYIKNVNWWKIGVILLAIWLTVSLTSYFLLSEQISDLAVTIADRYLGNAVGQLSVIFVLFIWLIIILVFLFLYFLPSIFALLNRHYNFVSIFIFNFFLGWTWLGWVLALVWAFLKPYQLKE